MKFRKWYYQNTFNWNHSSDFGFGIDDIFYFDWQGFKRQKKLHPYSNKYILSIRLINKQLTFRIGIQNKTCFYVSCQELKYGISRFIHRKDGGIPF